MNRLSKSLSIKSASYGPILPFFQLIRTLLENHNTSGEKCLLVDDEQICIEIEKEMLEYFGYQVTTIQDNRAVLGMIKENPGYFDLLVLNTFMPGVSGDALANELMSIIPSMSIVICPTTDEPSNLCEDGSGKVKSILQKQISMFEMVYIIRAVKDNCASATHLVSKGHTAPLKEKE